MNALDICFLAEPFELHVSVEKPKEKPKEKLKPVIPEIVDVDDAGMRVMQKALSGMMNKLEARIHQTESLLGDKLQRLDKDRDGVLNSQELEDAVRSVLKQHPSSAVAEDLVTLLDTDKDGKGEGELVSF
jgi:hypothetical protein